MEKLEYYLQQEKTHIFEKFLHKDAFVLGSYLSKIAIENNYPVAIEIEISGEIIFQYINDGACENNRTWIKRKKNVVKRFQMSSGAVAAKLSERQKIFKDIYGDDTDYAVVPGAVPIRVSNVGVIGVVGVSGLKSDLDHQLIIGGLDYLMKYQNEEAG